MFKLLGTLLLALFIRAVVCASWNSSVHESCSDPEGNEGICVSIRTCEKLSAILGKKSILQLHRQFEKGGNSCTALKVCCAVAQPIPEYLKKLVTLLPQNPYCGYPPNESESIRGICMSQSKCMRFSKLFDKLDDPEEHEDCGGSTQVCCILNSSSPEYFPNATICELSDDSRHSVGGTPTNLEEFPSTVLLEYKDCEWQFESRNYCHRSQLKKFQCKIAETSFIALAVLSMSSTFLQVRI